MSYDALLVLQQKVAMKSLLEAKLKWLYSQRREYDILNDSFGVM